MKQLTIEHKIILSLLNGLDCDKIFKGVSSRYFRDLSLRLIYDGLKEQYLSNGLIDVNLCGGWQDWMKYQYAGFTPNIDDYIRKIKDDYQKQEMFKGVSEILKKASSLETTGNDLLSEARNLVDTLENDGTSQSIGMNAKEIVEELEMEALMPEKEKFLSGHEVLDEKTGGFEGSQLVIIAARPGVGKSVIACDFARQFSMNGKHGIFFALEMKKTKVAKRFISALSELNYSKVKSNNYFPDELPRLEAAKNTFANFNLIIDDTSNQTVDNIRLTCKQLKQSQKLDYIIIDYLGLMDHQLKQFGSLNNALGNTTRKLKLLAMELDVPVFVLSQLSRANAKEMRAPKLDDLRDSGNIEQDADTVIFLHRPDKNQVPEEHEFVLEYAKIIIAKCREGEPHGVMARWEGQFQRFKEIKKDDQRDAYQAIQSTGF